MRTTRLHQTHYVPQSHLGCTNAFHMAARDIGYLVDDLVDERGQVLGAKPLAVPDIMIASGFLVRFLFLGLAQPTVVKGSVLVQRAIIRV